MFPSLFHCSFSDNVFDDERVSSEIIRETKLDLAQPVEKEDSKQINEKGKTLLQKEPA